MANNNINRSLTGINPLAYLGINASASTSASQTVVHYRAPTINDSKNFIIGCLWLWPDTDNPAHDAQIWMLTALLGNDATWTELVASGANGILTVTGDSGGAVGPLLGNINLVAGAGSGLSVVGNPGTYTLTIAGTGGGSVVNTLTGNSGGAVPALAGNINILGTGDITVVGNPGTNTLTITPSGALANSFVTDSGTATPALGIINDLGANVVTTTGSGNTITTKLTNGSNGQVIIGGGSDPAWATLTSTGGTITFTAGANTLNLEATALTPTTVPSFLASVDGLLAQNNVTGDGTPYNVIYNTVTQQGGTNYNVATGLFTAPITGTYQFNGWVSIENLGAGHTKGYVALSVNGGGGYFGTTLNCAAVRDSDNLVIMSAVTTIALTLGDTVGMVVTVSNSTKTVNVGSMSGGMSFSGHLVT